MFVQNRILLSCCFALVAAVAVSGCGGGEISTTVTRTTTTTTTMPPAIETPLLERDVLFRDVQDEAPAVSTEAQSAAGNAPSAGSVTQSSNGNGEGSTDDTVSVATLSRDAGGAFEFSLSKTGGTGWAVRQDDGRRVVTNTDDNFEGFELEERVGDTGTVYVNFYTDIRQPATETVTTPADPFTLADEVEVSLRWEIQNADLRLNMDGQRGTRNGVEGTYSCAGNCPAISPSVVTVSINPFKGTDWMFTPDDMIDIVETPDTDWLAGGTWLYIPDSGTEVEIGAFGDGGDPFDDENFLALNGTAEYSGEATGIYAASRTEGQTEVGEVGYFDADVNLIANFGDSDATVGTTTVTSNSIAGGLSNFALYTPEDGVFRTAGDAGNSVALNADLPSALPASGLADDLNSGFFSRDLTLGTGALVAGTTDLTARNGGATIAVDLASGSWGGQFFGNGEPTDLPTSVGGTFGLTGTSSFTEAEGEAATVSDLSLVGTFGAER